VFRPATALNGCFEPTGSFGQAQKNRLRRVGKGANDKAVAGMIGANECCLGMQQR